MLHILGATSPIKLVILVRIYSNKCMAKIKQISHLTCKLKFLECSGVHTVSVCTIITAWLSDRKLFYRICSYNILELMQRVLLALPLNMMTMLP